MGHPSSPELLTLHAVRVTGMTDAFAIAHRTGLAREVVEDLLLDDEARGWVQRVAFADLAGWSLTETGRLEGERRLADELERTGARPAVDARSRHLRAAQRAVPAHPDPLADPAPGLGPARGERPRRPRLGRPGARRAGVLPPPAGPLCAELTAALERFAGYDERYAAALARAEAGQARWVDGVEVDSCHTVWIQLHEDLLATLGIDRSTLG